MKDFMQMVNRYLIPTLFSLTGRQKENSTIVLRTKLVLSKPNFLRDQIKHKTSLTIYILIVLKTGDLYICWEFAFKSL